MPHKDHGFKYFREKVAIIREIDELSINLENKISDQTILHNWVKEGGNPRISVLNTFCRLIGIQRDDFKKDMPEFLDVLKKICNRSEEELVALSNNARELVKRFASDSASEKEFIKAVWKPLIRTNLEIVTELFEEWKGQYYLYHYTISTPGMITRANINICGIEDRFMCASVQWPNNAAYKGIVAIGANKWYFILGSTVHFHEIAQIVTFDPSVVGIAEKKLHGILMGCTEQVPQIPSAVKVFIVKVDGDPEDATNLHESEVHSEIRSVISNSLHPDAFTLQSSVPAYLSHSK